MAVQMAQNKGWEVCDFKNGDNDGHNPYEGKDSALETPSRTALRIFPTQAISSVDIVHDEPLTSVDIFSLEGTLLLSHRVEAANSTTVDISKLPNGCYLVVLRTISGKVYSQRLLVRH